MAFSSYKFFCIKIFIIFIVKKGGRGGLGDVALYMTKSETQPKTKTPWLGLVAALMI